MSLSRRSFLYAATAAALSSRLPAAEQASAGEQTPTAEDAVIDLRQYTLRGGQRDTLITLFERTYIDPQNAAGAHVIGTFRDLDDPDRFVWLRGFRDMPSRHDALTAFYGGPAWKATKAAANATIVDSDNVLLLRPAGPRQGFPPSHAGSTGQHLIGARIYYLGSVDAEEFARFFDQTLMPRLAEAGVKPVARLVTESSPNNFPQLPIREHDRVFVWFGRWPDSAAEEAFNRHYESLSGWRDMAPESVLPALMRKPERLRLEPTAKSDLR